jgi:hypothetical protein
MEALTHHERRDEMLKEMLGAKVFKFAAGGGAVVLAATGFGLDSSSADPPDAVDMDGERSPEAEFVPLNLEGSTVTVPPSTQFNDSLDSPVGSGRDDSAWDDSPNDSPAPRATRAANDSPNSPDNSPASPDNSPASPDNSPASPDDSGDSADDS